MVTRIAEDRRETPKEWLSPSQLAEELMIPLSTVYVWRTKHKGPRGHKIGAHVRYSRESVNEWLATVADPREVR